MGKILALDIGAKRTGVAETDPLQMIASGRETVLTQELLPYLKRLLAEESYDEVVIGDPVQMDGTPSESKPIVEKYRRSIEMNHPDLKIVLMDERFTSKMASASLLDSGLKKKDRRSKSLLDEVSATIILQDYLNSKGNRI
jgi:putative Holliday junction resolvase